MEKKISKFLIISTAILGLIYGSTAFAIRKADYDSVIVESENDYAVQSKPTQYQSVHMGASVKDSSEKLYGIVGKSQILKFDEPVVRVSITDPQYADLVLISPKELLLNAKKAGSTSLVFWGNNNRPVFYNFIIQQDTDSFLRAVDEVAPNEDIKLIFTNDNQVVLSGRVSSKKISEQIKQIAEAYKYKFSDATDGPTKQVLLEVKITEIARSFTNELATEFSFGQGTQNFMSNTLNAANRTSQGFFDGTINGFQYIFADSAAKLAFSIRAGEKNGLIKILAEPKLLALDGEEAKFNVGNEIPVPSQIGQYGQVSYEFKNTGVILGFKPEIIEKSNRVKLKLTPEVSEIDDSVAIQQQGGGIIPGFKTRKVETTVELGNGETLIIAGLIKQTNGSTKTKLPWISNIPVLGLLFTNLNDTKDDTELVIFITPKIIDTNVETL